MCDAVATSCMNFGRNEQEMLEEHRQEEDRLDDDERRFRAQLHRSGPIRFRGRPRQTLHGAGHLQEQSREERRRDEQGGEIPHAAFDLLVDDGRRHRHRQVDAPRLIGTRQVDRVFVAAWIDDPSTSQFDRVGGNRMLLSMISALADFRVQSTVVAEHLVDPVEIPGT